MPEVRVQAVTGVTPPQEGEARIREAYPSVARMGGVANLGRMLTRSIFLAPLGWLLMSGPYFLKLAPILMRRYTLTNRRLMIRNGWSGKPGHEIALADIDDVRVVTDANSDFFRAATLEVISKGQVQLRLPGLPEAEAFRIAVLNACNAWVPGRAARGPFVPASATT